MPPLEQHPLHVHYGLALAALELPRVHRTVEGGHRAAAWRAMLCHVEQDRRPEVVDVLKSCLNGWRAYKDDVAHAVGLSR
jgi:pyrroloquinoline-quinone synthase